MTPIMRFRAAPYVFIMVVLWATVTYFSIFHQSNAQPEENDFDRQLNKIEAEMNELIESNKILLQELEKQLEQKYLSTMDSAVSVNESDKSQLLEGESDKNMNLSLPEKNFHNSLVNLKSSGKKPQIAVLVISCDRVTVQRCIDRLIKFRPDENQFPIVVSQDCRHQGTSNIIKSYGNSIIAIQQPDQSDIEVPPKERKFKGYFKIARHYKWALDEIFFNFKFESVIVVEDDLDVAPDFFEYFLGTHSILQDDPSLWCISAWNDNGRANLVDLKSPHLLYRTDFFPGLGWMLTIDLWRELSPKWPKAYWDDWIRQPEQRKNRACIRPELSRTRTFGKIGVSNGLFYDKHLKFIKLNEQSVAFTKMNLSYLIKETYDPAFINEVYRSKVVTFTELKSNKISASEPIRIPYYTRQTFKTTAKMLGLMDDFKSGVPRTGYRGIVTLFYNERRVYLAPTTSWSGYDLTWS